ncbi:MAG: cytochrome c-type biogenesis protein CcmH [Actinomycetota bacterium]|nr:cytochrome c-type biogenesis protein CcmH [Actinomycetota bacterium]
MRRTSLLIILALVLLAALAPAAGAQGQRTSLPDIEDEVMCTTCNVPLHLAESSPQAERQRAFIRDLVAQGATKEQVKAAMVDEYGENVLALPGREGFDLAAYLVPIGLVLVGGVVVAIALPRWRRRARARAGAPSPAGPALSPADTRRLDEDLARYGR